MSMLTKEKQQLVITTGCCSLIQYELNYLMLLCLLAHDITIIVPNLSTT